MQVIYHHQEVNKKIERGIALGNFDGVHTGHQKLIHHLLQRCKLKNLQSCVYTFVSHTMPVINNKSSLQYITNIDQKKKVFEDLGIELLVLDAFNKALMALSPEEFVEEILVKELNCKEAVVGFDYRFGHKAKGDPLLLKKLGEKHGFKVSIIDAVKIEEEKVSSSNIRQYLKNGDIEKVNLFLGRYFSLHSKVIHGDARGTKLLGFPTANIFIDAFQLIPKAGVYATLVKVGEKFYKGATSVGIKPTFEGKTSSIETFIIDFHGDLYHEYIEVYFVKRLRGEIKFSCPEDLVKQINEDVKQVKNHLQYGLNVLK
ncbi:bifunctional riboflavin kinase/FAD synthetase [Clostridium formicaceticum]|uniref:Riboflavin biosynthesis protein n=1 Tax=Clostridium formicaceticum TaxID=1497 RepID=A0AAC9WHL4_9CLOT|nr:bifunctional riboflavin kinase/FAD synthetase [Clostridium formicaceticum]AOY77271.1 riboflavin biosynthesis protein RibF [Clostridium formicaceticum]ARE87810.1 Riboflavin biosynthesis protein RibF [Clostridium formicaceticum]